MAACAGRKPCLGQYLPLPFGDKSLCSLWPKWHEKDQENCWLVGDPACTEVTRAVRKDPVTNASTVHRHLAGYFPDSPEGDSK